MNVTKLLLEAKDLKEIEAVLTERVKRFTGHTVSRIELDTDNLNIFVEDGESCESTLLWIQLSTAREIYGRLRHTGLTWDDLTVIHNTVRKLSA